MAKKDKNSLLNIHYSRTLTPDNLSKAANYAGEYVLKGLGTLGKFLNAGFTSPTYGTTGQVSYARNAEDVKRLRELSEASEQAVGKAMTWISPLNYGAAVWNGHGLDARKGEEEVASWSPALQAVGRLGELYVGPKAVKGVKATPKAVVNTAAKAGIKPAKAAMVAREIKLGIKLNTKNGRIEVTDAYFNSPDKWYRITETPEKYGIMELGKNVTTHDAPLTQGTINGWRSSVLNAKVTKGAEGFIKNPPKIELNIRRKNGQAHGNTSQAAKGKLWGGTTSGSRLFPEGVIEGQAPSMINYGIDRTNFVITPWDLVPNGGRIGFHTGEMPMSNLGWFQRTNKGTYTYEPIIPEKRITYHPILLLEPSTSLKFFERKPARISEAERAGVPKGERNLPFKEKQLTEHVQGDEAVKMFKEYGGEPIPEGSINGELLRKYVAEARERYGLKNNKNITDEEIAQALYKHSKELGGNTAAVNALGEPLLLFRGDTRRYTQLKERMSPEELAKKSGTMDNSLGNLFLGELPGTAGKRTRGLERYLVTGREFIGNKVLEGSGTGSKAIMPDGTTASEWGKDVVEFPEGSYPLVTYNTKYGPNTYYKLPSSYSESGVNDINAFIVRTPQMRDASREISVLNDDFMIKGGPKVEYHGPIRREVLDKDGFPLIVDGKGNVVADGLAGSSDRQAMALHYRYVLNDAKNKKQGLLKSNGETDGTPGNYLRDEHDDYTYFALPNFNIQGAKHLLPYDLRKTRNWKDKNIYRGLIPLTTGYTLYNLFNQPLLQLQYLKQGGKMNILEFLKKGSGIHIKEKNKGKFTSYCGGKVTDECIRKAKSSGNPTLVKRATFALNARRWKHKEGGIIKALGGSKFNWLSIASIGGTLLNTYLLNKKVDSQAKAALAEEKVDLSKTFFDLYQEGLKKAALLEQLLIKAAEAMTGTVTNASPISILNNAYRYASAGYGLKKSEQNLKNALIKALADAEKFDNTTSAISGLILNGLGMISDYYNNNKSSSSSYNSPSYFSNYVNSLFKNYGTFNSDGSMNLGNGLGTISIKDGYKPRLYSMFDYTKIG